MSAEVAVWLEELAERAETRRRRVAMLNREASSLAEFTSYIRWELEQTVAHAVEMVGRLPQLEPIAAEQRDAEAPLLPDDASDGVLHQVQALLAELDVETRDHWNADDMRLLVCLQEAWSAAARQGYRLDDLIAVLRSLQPGSI